MTTNKSADDFVVDEDPFKTARLFVLNLAAQIATSTLANAAAEKSNKTVTSES